jgi:PTH1 family peptidyl-tRNA hydrolase
MFLIVGLGNPGEQYAHTRHNAGFDVLALLSQKLKIPITQKKRGALVGEGVFGGEKVALCLPQTYMNLSGEAVRQLLSWYKLPLDRLLVIFDDIDLAPGWLRIRKDGSAGTHNGMRSVVECVGTESFARIRVGVGTCPPTYDLADWVLSHFNTPEERQLMFGTYQLAADAAVEWMQAGVSSAMNKYNTKKPKPPKPPKTQTTGGETGAPAQPTGATE